MKKAVSLILCLVIILSFGACVQSEYIDLSVFVERFNKQSPTKISYGDFYIEGNSNEKRWYLPLENVSLRLFGGNDNKLSECRVILTKMDKTGKRLNLSDDDYKAFFNNAVYTICAFTEMSNEEATALLNEFTLNKKESFEKEGELTKSCGDYYFVYLSTPLESELLIYNKWLHEIESTLKPESKIPFDMTTATRSETVPHK